jgi:hypothetical protein
MKRMLPVEFATKTCPSLKKLKESTSPVTIVMHTSIGGNGPCRGSTPGIRVWRTSDKNAFIPDSPMN